MEIVKSLNLNKNYKDVQNASIVCAKNVITDDTGSYITTEPGFREAFTADEGYVIVGVVEAINEIVIFLYNKTDKTSKIYRLTDDGSLSEIPTQWKYKEGTTLHGTYTYNRDGELVIALSSYDNSGKKYPLEVWNLNTESNISTNILKQEPDIPQITNIVEDLEDNGTLVCGTYTFFIRYKISKATFTKWFPLTGDIHIIDSIWKEAPKHTYQLNGSKIILGEESLNGIVVNKNKQSSKNIVISFDVTDKKSFKTYQIGFIIKRHTSVLGRLKGTYDFTTNTTQSIKIFNNTYAEEINVDKFLESPHQFYNVKALATYNNRLYVGNYKEYDIQETKQNITITLNKSDIIPRSTYNVTENYKVKNIATYTTSISSVFTQVTIDDINYEDDTNIPNAYSWLTNNIVYNTNIKLFGNKYTLEDLETKNIKDKDNHSISGFYIFVVEDNKIPTKKAHCLYSTASFGSRTDNETTNYSYTLRQQDGALIAEFTSDKKEFNLNDSFLAIVVAAENAGAGNTVGYYILGLYQDGPLTTYRGKELTQSAQLKFLVALSQQVTNFAKPNVPNITIENITYKNINNRTLLHKQNYDIFIHYVRSDGSSTAGLYVGSYASNDNWSVTAYRYITVSNVTIPVGYVGYFLSYRDIIQTVQSYVGIDDEKTTFYSSANFIYNNEEPKNTGDYEIEDNLLREPTLKGAKVGGLLFLEYTKDIKTNNVFDVLFRLTPTYYDTDNKVVPFYYYPGYIHDEKVFHFTPKCLISPSSNSVISEYGLPTAYNILFSSESNYSAIPLDAYSVKQNYVEGAVQLIDSNGDSLGVCYNKVLTPAMIRDFLEIHPAYTAKPDKGYIQYNEDYTDSFSTTIYRSNVISDESLYNGFREFDTDNYKNIFENKGDIINLVPYGLYFIIHTQYALFVIDRNSAINRRVQLDIPDTFDITYKEVIPGSNGLGGITKREHSLLTTEGYFWFDSLNKLIFQFNNGQAGILSKDINDFIKLLDVWDCRFVEDIINHRLLICLSHRVIENNVTSWKQLTISYSFVTKTFISLHDYSFSHNYKTSGQSYLFNNSDGVNTKLYVFDNSETTYKGLSTNTGYFADQYYKDGGVLSYVDIIINSSYEIPKVLNSIGYVLNVLNNIPEKLFTSALLEDRANGSDFEYVNKYSGYKLQIFNDQTNTGELDISLGTPHNPNPSLRSEYNKSNFDNLSEPYSKPYYDKGRWNFNYFRDTSNKRKLLDNGSYTSLQDNRLIYGKYFIVRFFFDMKDIKPKLETIDVNINNY